MKCRTRFSNNEILILTILAMVVFFSCILPIIDNSNIKYINEIKEQLSSELGLNSVNPVDSNGTTNSMIPVDSMNPNSTYSEYTNNDAYSNPSNLDKSNKIDMNRCSKQCCKHVQWNVPIANVKKEISNAEMENYIGTNLSCNSNSGSGCLCMTKNNFNTLSNRGFNSSVNTCVI